MNEIVIHIRERLSKTGLTRSPPKPQFTFEKIQSTGGLQSWQNQHFSQQKNLQS